MRLYETTKLHYGKYLYKLAIVNACASYFRTEFQPNGDLKWCEKRLDELHSHYKVGKNTIEIPWGSRWKDTIPVDHFNDAILIYRHLKRNTEYKVRCEMNCLHLYSNDRKMLVDLGNKLKQRYIEFWEPNPENIGILNNTDNIILCKTPPKYEYKITLGKKLGQPSLAKWIDANPNLGKMGEIAKETCRNNGWVKGYYFFIRDYKTLTIAQMLVGDNIQRIDKLVYVAS